jgi:hypothetical protein
MATKLYMHDVSSIVLGTLPSTQQSSQTPTQYIGSVTANKSMDTIIGSAQTSISASKTDLSYGSMDIFYLIRFVSDKVNTTSIAANTWTVNYAVSANPKPTYVNVKDSGGNPGARVIMYVWRPSTGAKVGNIFDNDMTCGYVSDNTERVIHGTVSGSAVTCQVGDVICIELRLGVFLIGGGSGAMSLFSVYYDGTTETSTDTNSATNHASYISTPQDMTFLPSGIECTVTGKLVNSKFITHV